MAIPGSLCNNDERHARLAAEARLDALVRCAAVGIVRMDGGGCILDINPFALMLLGYGRDELIGRNVKCLMPEHHGREHDGYLARYLGGGDAGVIGSGREVEALHRDGRRIPVHLAVSEITIPDRDEREFVGILTDLSAVREAQREVRDERVLLASIINGSRTPIFAKSLDGRYLVANSAAERGIHASPGSMVGHTAADILPAEDAVRVKEADQHVMREGVATSLEVTLADGARYELAKSPLTDADGQIRGVVTVGHDISALHRAAREIGTRQTLQDMSQRFARMVPWVMDLDTRIVRWMGSEVPLFGEKFDGRDLEFGELLDMLDADDRESVLSAMHRTLEHGEPFQCEYRLLLRGREFWVRADGDLLYDAEGRPVQLMGMLQDRTHRRKVEIQEEQQRRMLKVLHQGLTDYRALMSGEGLWAFLLDALRDLTGSEHGMIGEVLEIEGRPAMKVHSVTDLSWSDESRALMERIRVGEMLFTNPEGMLGRVFAGGEVVLSNDPASDGRRAGFPHGHPKLCNYLCVPIRDDDKVIGMYAIANRERGYVPEMVEWLEPFTASCALLINLYRQFEARDLVARQLAEARDGAERASRKKTDFLSSMSHELRTPLNVILGFAELLSENRKNPLVERQKRQVAQIIGSGRHLLELINEALDLARIEAGKMQFHIEPVRLADLVHESLETIEALAHADGVVVEPLAGAENWPCVAADHMRLRQVLLNLLSNAVKYNQPAGRVWIACVDDGSARVVLRVSDSGRGIPPERMEDLFQPFNRLGEEDGAIEGTGIGLALTKNLMEHMGGEIGVESVLGEGSTFWIALPRATRLTENCSEESLNRPVWSPGTHADE